MPQARWVKCHPCVVEECRVLSIQQFGGRLQAFPNVETLRWRPSRHISLTLVARQAGGVRRFWFRCPRCTVLRESLFVPPSADAEDWRCRLCWNLIYASQRYGRRHPLRQVLTPRKRVSKAKAEARRERQEARARDEEAARRRLGELEALEQARAAEARQREQRPREAAWQEARSRVRTMLEADLADNLEFLQAIKDGNLSPRSVQGQAARMLARAARNCGITPPR